MTAVGGLGGLAGLAGLAGLGELLVAIRATHLARYGYVL